MKTEEQIREEIKTLEKQIHDSYRRARGVCELLATACLNGRNQIRLAALYWILDEEKMETKKYCRNWATCKAYGLPCCDDDCPNHSEKDEPQGRGSMTDACYLAIGILPRGSRPLINTCEECFAHDTCRMFANFKELARKHEVLLVLLRK